MFVRREKLLSSIGKVFSLSKTGIVYGAAGSGKTELIQTFQKESKEKFLWITLEEKLPIEEVLSYELDIETEGKSLEWILRKFSKEWGEYSFIVWDNIESLPERYLNILLNFCATRSSAPKQIFVSNSLVTDDFFPEVPKVLVEGLSRDEVSTFLTLLESEKEVEEVMSKTSGVPLLLKLYLLSEKGVENFLHKELSSLNDQQQSLIELWSVLSRSVKEEELETLFGPNANKVVKELYKNGLVDQSSSSNFIIYSLRNHIQAYYLETLNSAKKEELLKELGSLMAKSEGRFLESLYLSLKTRDDQSVDELLEAKEMIPLVSISSLSHSYLESFLELIDSRFNRGSLKLETRSQLSRLIVKILLTLEKRKELLERKSSLIDSLNFSNLSRTSKYLCYEYSSFLNSYYHYEKSLKLLNELEKSCDGELELLVRIELCVASMQDGFDVALGGLENVLKKIVNSEHKDNNKILGPLFFQIGRCAYQLSDYKKSSNFYKKSIAVYEDIGNLYLKAVCQMNLGWILLKEKDFDSVMKLYNDLAPFARDFDHKLVLSGVCLLKAKAEKENLYLNNARTSIDESYKAIGLEGPYFSFRDVSVERIRICLLQYDRVEAESCFEVLKSKLQRSNRVPDHLFLEIQNEIESLDESLGGLVEKYDEVNQVNMYSPFIKDLDFPMGETILEKSYYYEKELISSIRDKEEKSKIISKVERFLSLYNENPQDLRFYIYSSLLALLNDKCVLEVNEENFLKSDKKVLSFFSQWQNAKDGKGDITWSNHRAFDNLKLRPLVELTLDKGSYKYELLEEGETSLVLGFTERNVSKKKIIFLEDLGDLWVHGVKIDEISKRNQLKKLLGLLLELYPTSASKEELSKYVWEEEYNPAIHDARIYTSIQRLRSLMNLDDVVTTSDDGYQLNPKYNYSLYKLRKDKKKISKGRNQALILRVFEQLDKTAEISRSELVSKTGLSESSIKREVSDLLGNGALIRVGKGRSTKYKLP